MINKTGVKKVLGELPLTAELYWQLRQRGKPLNKSFSLRHVEKRLPEWRVAVETALRERSGVPPASEPKKVLLFSVLHYWIEHAALLGMALAGLGNSVTLAYLPYPNWRRITDRFDLRRHNAYSRRVLGQAAPYLSSHSLLHAKAAEQLPPALERAVLDVSIRDVQYTLQVEDVDLESDLFSLRLERNTQAARACLVLLQEQRPDVLLTPNGSILEMGAAFQVARYLDIPVVTYEFGEQHGRIWLARNGEVMRQETCELWQVYKDRPLSKSQQEQIRALFASRQQADLWRNFSRRWQGIPSQGGEKARLALGLDSRPLVLLAANVIGDSLTLGRQVFSQSMTEWLQRTVAYFAARSERQLVVRIHPGERYTKGPSVADVLRQALPDIPKHIHLVAASDRVNTYDLVEVADLGLVYTTTVGMEMAMSGVPVIVAGQTHYRGKGFTLDPDTWEAYFDLLDQRMTGPESQPLTEQQVESAWCYAYHFYFDYPQPFPWHLLGIWQELEEWPLSRVLSKEGQAIYGNTFNYLLGEAMHWQGQSQFTMSDLVS